MAKHPFKAKVAKSPGRIDNVFKSDRAVKVGTSKNPVALTVQSTEREAELAAICDAHGWAYQIAIQPALPEDITQLEMLLNKPKTVSVTPKIDRNASCPCGSNKKYKKCCGGSTQ